MKINKPLTAVLLLTAVAAGAVHFQETLTPLHRRLVSPDDDRRSLAFMAARNLDETEKGRLAAALRDALAEPDPATRRFALYALRKLSSPTPELISAYLAAARDADRNVATEAVISLTESGKEAVRPMVAIVAAQDPRDRTAALQVLKNLAGDSAPALVALLDHENPRVRMDAIETLGKIGAPAKDAVASLARFLKDKDADARFSAAVALNQIDPAYRATLPVHLEALRARSWEAGRLDAVTGLESLGAAAKPALADLRRAMLQAPDDLDGFSRPRPVVARAILRIEQARQDLASLLTRSRSTDAADRYLAAFGLSRMEALDAAAVPALIALSRDADPHVAARCALAFSRIGWKKLGALREDAIAAFVGALSRVSEAQSKGITALARKSLAEVGPDAVPAAMDALQRGRLTARAADDGLSGTGANATEAFRRYLQNVHDELRLVSALNLARLGSNSEALVPVLYRGLRHGDAEIRARCVRALEAMGTPEAQNALRGAPKK